MTVATRWIEIAADGGHYEGYLALPPGNGGKGPGIVLLQEIFGVNAHIRAVAEQYALDGYVVLAPDVFWRAERRVDLGYEGADREKGIALLQRTDVPQAVSDIGAAARTLRARPELAGGTAVLGYCFGGRLAYLSAAAGSFDAAVAYYGGGIDQHLDVADAIAAPILFHYGERDASIPAAAVDKVRERFAGRTNATVHLYADAGHGFNCPLRASYHQRAAALAHGRTLQFLAAHL